MQQGRLHLDLSGSRVLLGQRHQLEACQSTAWHRQQVVIRPTQCNWAGQKALLVQHALVCSRPKSILGYLQDRQPW